MNELPDEILTVIAQRFAALADVNRLRILQRLRSGRTTVSGLSAELGLSQPNTSAHLSVLRNAGLVVATRAGKNIFYGLADNTANDLCDAVCSSLQRHLQQFATFLPATKRKHRSREPRAGRSKIRLMIKKEETRP